MTQGTRPQHTVPGGATLASRFCPPWQPAAGHTRPRGPRRHAGRCQARSAFPVPPVRGLHTRVEVVLSLEAKKLLTTDCVL